MKRPAISRDKAQAVRRWIFRWRGLDGTPFPGLIAIVLTGGAFAFFAATVKIHVSAPQQWVERKASIIHLSSEGEGKMWALRAQEGGPFPARLDPSFWEKTALAGTEVIGATRLSPEPYQPKLRDLPQDDAIPQPPVAAKGERVFPIRAPKAEPETTAVIATRMTPEIYPLSGVSLDEIPALPAFELPVDAALTSGAWRFLLRLRADGSVADCIALSDEPGGNALAHWLRGVTFNPATAKKSEWIGIGVFFTNQAVHGPDAR
jgi:hypothetical protein